MSNLIPISERGSGRPVLVLHGGAGPGSVVGWADRLAAARPARVLTPTHPGFDGADRPAGLDSIARLAAAYAELLADAGLTDVVVVGNSIGGWIAAELALLHPPAVSGYVLVDAMGVDVPGHPVVDFFGLGPADIARHSFYDPTRFDLDPAAMTPQQLAQLAANREALRIYGGTTMTDPTLLPRLAEVTDPTLVVWGAADRIGDPDMGRAYAAAIPGAEFALIEKSGHLPQLETPDELIDIVWSFAQRADAH